jgi:hypothetical protein
MGAGTGGQDGRLQADARGDVAHIGHVELLTPSPRTASRSSPTSWGWSRRAAPASRLDTREEVLLAADIFQDQSVFIEAGPAKHTPVHSFCLYGHVPGGNRVEVTSEGNLVFDPDPEATVRWPVARCRSSRAWGRDFPPSFDTYATPQPG